jgi:hypothetical protein
MHPDIDCNFEAAKNRHQVETVTASTSALVITRNKVKTIADRG